MNNRKPNRQPHPSKQETGSPVEAAASPDGEDVVFDMEMADEDDLTALARAEAADRRATGKAGRRP